MSSRNGKIDCYRDSICDNERTTIGEVVILSILCIVFFIWDLLPFHKKVTATPSAPSNKQD